MAEKLYKMSDVAKLHNITKKTLRYYEKINLFTPDHVSGENNYKYYARKNFPILKQIIYLKDIGFTLTEIKYLLENRSQELMIEELKKRLKIVGTELEQLVRIKSSISYLINFYERASIISDNDLNRPSIRVLESRKVYSLISEENSKGGIMFAYRKILGILRNLDQLSHQLYGSFYSNHTVNDSYVSGAFILLPNDSQIDNVKILPKGKYISMFHKGSYYNEKDILYLKDWLKRNNYKAVGDFYDYCIVDRTFSENEDVMTMELQVQVI